MNYECLKAVLAVYRSGSFSNAAYELYVSQSSISKNVAKAEAELQVKLFERSGKHVVPTPVGKSLMGSVEEAVRSYNTLLEDVALYTRRGGKSLVISTTPWAAGLQLTEMLCQCSKCFPAPQIQVRENTNRKSIMALESGEVDLAVTIQTYINGDACGPFSISTDPRFLLQPLFRDDYFAVVPAGHPLAKRTEISLEEFRNEDFVSVDRTFNSYHAMLEKAFAPLGFQPRIAFLSSSISIVLDMVKSKVGCSILTKRVAQGKEGVVFVPLTQNLCRETAFVCLDRKPLPSILQWMMRYAKTRFSEQSLT